ncbi:putative Late embryogenesis abundant protein, LEA-14 [Rosa chinensis]|uniref:Putative Late embryogenesis abundant protein, LEA-14 n=1 Tax=Rosa chinensis TaxID=74649 RepID=A0A2P6R998_ROSCH|nr:NDR1/HIN1-like protein 10 [Rosa chinensis]PRQ42991.1 putative Late embryogenesis abundant protein, LEA-14 [Rosa chinensis]
MGDAQSSCACGSGSSLFLSLISIFFIWVIVLPRNPKITITDALLTQFSFTNTTTNSTLYYNLAFNLTIRNPNKRLGISYRRIRVIGNYQKKRFALVTLPNTTVPFYQGHKNTTFLSDIIVQGQQVVKFGKKEISEFNKEIATGIYNIDAVLALRVKLRLGTIKFHNYGPENIHCKLKLPLSTRNSTLNQTSVSSSFNVTNCGHVSVVTGFFLSWFS